MMDITTVWVKRVLCMQKYITRPTKKQLLIFFGIVASLMLMAGAGWWLVKLLADTPALKIGEKVIYSRDYYSFIKQAESAGFTKKDAQILLIDYYRLQEAVRVSKFPVSNEYANSQRDFYKKQNSKMTDAVAYAQAYRAAVQRVINLQGIEGVDARLVRLPFRSQPNQYGLPTKDEAQRLITTARNDIVERKSDDGIEAMYNAYPSIGITTQGVFTNDGFLTGYDGRTIYKPIPVLKDDIKSHIAKCQEKMVCEVQQVAYTNTFFFMHIIDRIKKVTADQVQAFEHARERVRVVEYIDEK